MADKKSWRDYTQTASTEKTTSEKKTGSWRDYTSGDSSTKGNTRGSWLGYSSINDIVKTAGENILGHVNNWLTSHNSYITDYQKRHEGRKYNYEDAYVSDSADWLNTITQKKTNLDTEADTILSYLDQYQGYLDEKWVNEVKKTITDARNTQGLIIDSSKKDNEYWTKFMPNEEQQAAGYTADKVYQEWQAGRKQYANDQVYDIDAGMVELEELKNERDAYLAEQEEKRKQAQSEESFWDSLGRWLGTTPDTSLPLGGASAATGSNSSPSKYDQQISALEEQINRAKYVQGYEGYMDNTNAGDYAANSQYVSTRTETPMEDAIWGFGNSRYDESKLFGDFLYDYINKNPDALDVAMVNDTASSAYFMGLDKGFLQTMTDDEIKVYNYLYNTQGKESANEFLSFIGGDLKGRKRQQEQAFWAAYAKENPVASSVFSTLISPLKGFSYLGQAADMLDDGKLEENAGYNRFSEIPSAIRSQVSTTIEKSGKWGKVGSFAYNTGMSMADFLFTTAVSGGNQALSLSIMGTGAAADATIAAKERGLDDGEAFALGTIAGLAEVAMEKISLGAWLEGDMSEGALKYMLKNALSEGGEEAGTSVINLLADVLIAGDKSEWNVAMQAYIDQGKSPEEAFGLVAAEQAAQIGLDALGGILSGGVIGGGTYAGTSVGAGIQYGDVGKNKVTAQELVAEGLQLAPDNQYIQKMQGKLDKGKTLTGMQVRNILASNQEQITTNDMKKIQKAAEARLTALGQTADVSKVAELATKWATGQELTRAEKRLLTTSQYGSRVANELLPSNIDSGKYSTEWAEEIGTRSVNAKSYNKKAIRTILDAMSSSEDPTTYKSLEDRVGVESSFGVSKSGQATIRETGEAISIDNVEVVGIDKGDMSLQVDGKEVKASDIDFADESQSYLFDAVSKIEHITPGAATAIIRDYNPTTGQTMGEYLNGIDEGYTYGYYGYSEADLKAGSFAPKLTSEQMMSAYKLGQSARKISDTSKTEAIKRMRTAVEAESEKATAEDVVVSKKEKTTQQNAKNLTVTYNKGGGKMVDIDKAGIKDAKRSGAVEVAKILHKMGLGTKVEFFSSYLSTDANGNEIRVFLDDNGVEQRAYSGVYRKSDGTIRIDLEAYNGRGLTLNALSHELTHFIQQWSAEKYQVLADFLIKSYEKTDMTMHERVLKEQARLEKIRGKEVSYDEAFDEVVANAMSKMFDDGKLVEKLTELRAEDESLARKLWEGFKKIMSKFLGIYENESALFKDAADLVEMKETFEQLQNMFAEALVEASENHQASQQIGLEIDTQTESVSPAVMNSEHTWTESDYVQERDKAAKEIAKAIGVSEKKAKDYIDSINSIAKMIAEDRSRLDYFSSPGRSSFVDNAEYGGSFDFSTLCKKRRLLTGTFTAIQKALPNTALTADEILDIRNRMKEANLEVSCGLCYVEGSRANMGQFAKEFLRLYKQYYPDAWQPNMADVNTPEGIEWVRINHPECYEQYEYFWNHYGTLKDGDKNLFASQQKPKLYQLHTEYKSEILQKFKGDDKVEDKNLNGGIRLQSFSDFEIVHLIDAMQIIMDMSRVGLAGQAYTKVPDFAWALGDTGLKINLSLIAKGVDADGKLIFDDVEGMPIADAMKLRDRYSKNVGTILVAFNDEQLLAAMADDRVDFIIPFHRSQWKKSQYEAMGLPAKTKDYTFMQNEKYIKPQFHEYRGRMVKDKASNYMPNEYWDFSKSGKENAVAYLEMCARNNKRPKFYKLLQNNGDGSYSLKADGSTDGYWKLLIDFKMYDNEGVGSPQMAVKPEFNMEEANRMLNDYKGGHSTFPVAKGIVDSFVKDYKASHKGEQYSSQETDLDSDGRQLSKEQAEYFKDSKVRNENGRLKVMYHGTANGGFNTFDTYGGKYGLFGAGSYFTDSKDVAKKYTDKFNERGNDRKQVYETYLNITNPIDMDALANPDEWAKAFPEASFPESGTNEDFFRAMEEYFYDEMYFKWEAAEIAMESIEGMGYDGITHIGGGRVNPDGERHRVYIAFKPEQIKNVDNTTPTSDSDIRYSSHETDVDSKAHPYSYDTLVSKPDMAVTEVDSNVPSNRADVVYQAKQNAAKVGRFDPKTGSVSVYVNDVGADVVIGTQGLKHGLEARREENSIVTLKAGEILKNSIRINELTPKRYDANGSYVLVGVAADNNGSFYIVRSVVNQFSYNLISMDVLYAINAKKGNRLRSMRPGFQGPVTDSTISVAELLDLVNQYFPDVLPEDVLKHYGYDARPDGVLGNDALYSSHETDLYSDSRSYAEITEEQQKLYQREMQLAERKREAVNNHKLLQAMDDYHDLFAEMKDLLSKRRQGAATQAEIDRIEEIKALREERILLVAELQESLGLNEIAKEETEIREAKETLRVAADAAWAREGADKENKAIEKAGVSAAEYFRKKALKAFKTTTNFNEAGYLLPDGTLLNFSGGERNHRYRDHREIGEIYEATQGTAALNRFLNDGNIRIMAESPGIDLASGVEPTKEQYAELRRFINTNGVKDGQFFVDFSGAKGENAGKYAYNGKIIADRIINDIKYFYQTGNVRESSGLTDFLYSEHETDSSNRSLLANAFEGITQNSNEYKLIQEYKGRIKLLNEYEAKLSDLNAEIRKILFESTGARDTARLEQLQAEAKRVAENINRNDKKLLSLEASEPLRKVIERERKKEATKTKEHVKEIQQNKKVRAEQTELRHKIRKAIRDLDKILNRGNKKLNVKEDMKGFASKALELADYIFTDHISNEELIRKGITVRMTPKEAALVKETEDILTRLYDNIGDLTGEEFARLDEKRKRNMEKLRDLLTEQRNEMLKTPVYNLFNDLLTEYASLKNSKHDAVKVAYDPNVESFLRSYIGESNGETDPDRKALLQNMRVADMTTAELERLYYAYKMVLHSVREANKLHINGKNESIDQVVTQIVMDFGSRKIPEKKVAIALQKLTNKLGWDYEKLYYALDRIGSEAFTDLIMNVANSENIVMQDIMEAVAFRDEMVGKYDFNNWDVNKEIDREFMDNSGKKFKMTLGQLMSLYAYSRREGAWDHIEYGGFVFGEAALTNPKPADSYKLNKAQCEAITNTLTKEQKGYVEDMQKFLSETMGEKGNEVSMILYGIKMFGEKNYFPIHIAGQFKAQAQESQAKQAAGFGSMSNAGFTHAQNPNAKAPFVLEGFNEVWADHVNEMSRYHGTVPALEDLRRVMNRSSYSDSIAESTSVKVIMENHFGKEAVAYFDNLYREANSGAITDKLEKNSKWLLSKFRKNSVAYSLSVLIQQPASIVRAYALVDKKYFGFKGFGTITAGIAKAVSDKWTKAHTNAYNEMLKYAPGVTMAKEIGGFDTATGGSIRSYLLDTKKSISQKWKTETATGKGKAVLDLVDNNAVANLPNVADKIAWIEIWNACKRETVAKHKDLAPNSEEFMQAVGERFTEVIRATQVYDSIFAKSPMLKSKSTFVQMLVSFMNEPNTVANMAESAVRDATRGDWKGGVKKAAVLIHSIIFTNVLKSIIYAMRDDDEDETYIEKYIESLSGGIMNDFNALNYIPLLRDVVSVAQGYDVERADMAIAADLIDAIEKVYKYANTETEDMTEEQLIEFDKKRTEANWKLVESMAAFFGIPVKNIRREINGVIDHAKIASANKGQTTMLSAWDKIYDTVIESIPFMKNERTKGDKLYDAIVSGDKAYLDRLKSTYKTDSAYQSAVRNALRENDSRIHDAAQARYDGNTEDYKRIFKEIQNEGRFSFDDIMSAINSEESAIRKATKTTN